MQIFQLSTSHRILSSRLLSLMALPDPARLPITSIAFIAVAAFGIFVLLTYSKKTGARGFPYPPGPRPHAIIGNLRDFPTTQPWVTYTQWKKEYGEFHSKFCLYISPQTFKVILSMATPWASMLSF